MLALWITVLRRHGARMAHPPTIQLSAARPLRGDPPVRHRTSRLSGVRRLRGAPPSVTGCILHLVGAVHPLLGVPRARSRTTTLTSTLLPAVAERRRLGVPPGRRAIMKLLWRRMDAVPLLLGVTLDLKRSTKASLSASAMSICSSGQFVSLFFCIRDQCLSLCDFQPTLGTAHATRTSSGALPSVSIGINCHTSLKFSTSAMLSRMKSCEPSI